VDISQGWVCIPSLTAPLKPRRSALYMPALSAAQHDVHVKAFYQHLIQNGKKPLQAVCAVMRKLLHAIHGMFKTDQPFDNTRFYAIPA
jgi:hypothetical protein